MIVQVIEGVTVNKLGHVLTKVTTHVGKNGETYADCFMFAPDMNDLDAEGKPKAYLIPVNWVHLNELSTPQRTDETAVAS